MYFGVRPRGISAFLLPFLLLLFLTACGRKPYQVVWSRPQDAFGLYSVAAGDLNGDGYGDLLIGISGGALAYFGSPAGLSPKPSWVYKGLPQGGVAYCVGLAGHLSASRYPLVYIAAPRVGGRGAVYLFRTGPKGPEAKPWKVLWSPDPGEGFAERVADAGDLWGDGYDDLAVGDFSYGHLRGRVYVYRGGPSGPSEKPAWSAQGSQPGDWFGYSLCGPGDLDGDGYADLVIGSKNCNGSCLAWMQGNPDLLLNQDLMHSAAWAKAATQPSSGRLSVFYGSKQGLGDKPGLLMDGGMPHELFAYDLEAAGDLEHDGHSCLLVGSMGWKDKRGLIQLFEGGAKGFLRQIWEREGSQADEGLGFRQSVVAKLDGGASLALISVGLGLDEDWLGRPFLDRSTTTHWIHLWQGPPTGQRFSQLLGSAGDLYGDGRNELFLLSPGAQGVLEVLRYH